MSSNPFDLSGRRFAITGASSGLGRAVATGLAGLGARTVLIARDTGRLEETRAMLVGEGHICVAIDLQEPDAIVATLKELANDGGGPFHGAVHAAGVMTVRPLRMLGAADFSTSMTVNVAAASAVAKGFRQRGVNAGGGSIVFISSVTGIVGQPAQSIYSATKGALISMARSLAVEMARERIRVNCVAPGVVETGMSDQLRRNMTSEQWATLTQLHPLGMGKPEDIAHAVAFLLADTGRWITGTTLVVDGGFTAQ